MSSGGGGGGSVGGGGSLSSSKSGRRLRKTKRGPDPSSRYHSSSSYNHHHHRGGGQPLPQQQQHQQYPLQQQQQHQHPHPERFFTVDESTAENDHSYHYGQEATNKLPSHHQQQYYNNNNNEGPVGGASSNSRQQNRRIEQQHRDNDMIALPHLEPKSNSAGVINGGGNNSEKNSHHPRPSLQPSKTSTTSAAKEFSSGAPPPNSDSAAKRSSSTTSTASSANNSGSSTGGAPVGGGGAAAASRRRQSATRLSHSSAGSNSASSLKGYSDSLGGGSGSYADAKSIGGKSASLAYSLESSNTFMKQMEESLEGRFVNLSSSKNSNNSSTGSGTNRRTGDAYGSATASPARSNNNNVYSVVDEEDGDDDEDEIPLEKDAVVMSQSPPGAQSQSSSHQDYEYVSSASSSEDEDDDALTAASSADGDMLDQISAAPSGLSMGMEDETEQHHMMIGGDNSLHYQDSSYPVVLTSPSQEQSLHSTSPPDRSTTTDSVKADVTTDFAKVGSISKNDQHIFRTKTPVDSDIVSETRDGTSGTTGNNNNNSQQPHDSTTNATGENVNPTERLPNESLREFWERRGRDAQQKDDFNQQQQSRSFDNVESQRAQDKIKKYKESYQPDIHPSPEQQGSFGSSSTASPITKKQTSKSAAALANEEHESSTRTSAAVSFNDPISNDSSSSRDPITTNGSAAAAAAGNVKSAEAALKASDTSALSEGGQLERISSEDSDYKSPTSLLNLLGDDDSDDDNDGDGGEAAAMEKKRASKKGGVKKEKKTTKDGVSPAELDTTHRIDNRSKEDNIVVAIDADADDRQNSRNLGESNTGMSAEDVIAGAKEAGTKSQVETAQHESAAVGQAQSQAHGQTQTEKETQKSSSTGWSSNRSVPNLHRDLAICSWSRLDRHLVKLSKHPKVLLQALTQQNPDLGNATPLHTACWKAPPPLALHMISLLTRIYKHMERVCLATDLDGNTPLHLSAANSCHIDPEHNHHHNDYDVYSGKDEIYGANGGGGTNGNTDAKSIPGFKEADVIEALVLSSPKALKIQNQEGDTPLHLAVSSSSSMERVVACLIDKPDADACLLQDCSGATPLHAAIGNQVSLRVLETIFDPAPEASRVVDHHGLLPLHYVAAFCHTPIEFVKQLLDAHPDAIFARTADGDTPLHLAISNAKEEEEEDDDNNNDEEESNKDNNDPDATKDTTLNANGGDGDAVVAGIKQHKTTLTIETIKLLLGNFSASDSRNPVFIKNHAELTPLQCCAEFDSPDNIKNVIVMHCVNHSPCQNWRERHSYAIDYARTANYTLPDNFDEEYKTNKKKEEEEASANAMAKKLLHGKKATNAKTTEPASVAFSEDLSSICFSEFLIDDDPSTVVEPPKHPERQSLRPQLEKLEEQLMNVALRSSTSKRDVTANNQSEDEQQQGLQNTTNAEEDITASPTTRQQQQQQWPQTDKGDSTAEVTPSASKSNTSGRGAGGVGDDPKGTPDTANRTRQSSQEDNHDGGGADDDSARSSVSSITCTIFLKNAGNIGPSWAKGGFGAGVGGAGAGGGMMGGGGNGGGLLGTFHERPQSTADKMEALARVVPYAADASRGTHRMPLSLANSEQVKEMAAMLSLPIFCKKTHVPSSPNAGGKSSKSTRSRRSTGAGAMSTKSERRQPRKHSVDTEERTRQGKPNS